jgi:hypothetical protein
LANDWLAHGRRWLSLTTPTIVMAGLVPAIHVFLVSSAALILLPNLRAAH